MILSIFSYLYQSSFVYGLGSSDIRDKRARRQNYIFNQGREIMKQDHQDQAPYSQPRNRHHATTIESDDQDEREVIERMKKQAQHRKRPPPQETDATPEKILPNNTSMDIQGRTIRLKTYAQLPDKITFYLTEIYPFLNQLFITGIMQNGQTMNLVATQPTKQLYFALRRQYSSVEQLSVAYQARAEKEIRQCLYQAGIQNYVGEFVQKEYVFQLQGVYREKRPYYRVRYLFSKEKDREGKEEIRADWEGETFKYIFGTTYTPLELTILNGGIKGPSWVSIDKSLLNRASSKRDPSTWVQSGLCAQLQDPQLLQLQKDIPRPSTVRVMSISIKAVVPTQVKLKKLFNTNRVDQLHIYAISYFYCDDYIVESKPSNYRGNSRTFFIEGFGPNLKDSNFMMCKDEKIMFGQLQADLRRIDPDVIVCHDSAKILDTLIQRMSRLGDRVQKPRLGRLITPYQQFNKSNQNQRITSTMAGRLVCDTFTHSKDMIKSVDYELQSMASHIKPIKRFQGMNDDQCISYLNDNKAFTVVKKAREEAQVTFALMNHLQILQITRQLSNICGNVWRRSLELQRAERNQYLIMHECVKRDLIIPDKFKKDRGDDDDEVDRKKYQGGHVLDPIKGFYKDYILLLDFNSLYPSIIREYNVCFSVIKRPFVGLGNYYRSKKDKEKRKEKKKMNEDMGVEQEQMVVEEIEVRPPEKLQCSRDKWGFLPQLIDKIVQRRKQCKKRMKNAPADKAIILDIQQKCYKLVANSIYGCLGFSISRFYSKHLAALITRMGRQSLMRAKEIVSSTGGVRVIYGDTDSLMIQPTGLEQQTEAGKLLQIKKVADELKGRINKEYDNLEIDIDGIFKPLILLMKKKYVARKLDNFQKVLEKGEVPQFSLEYKGIEVVRRDGFELARKFLRRTLQILMNSEKGQAQETYEQIYEFAREFTQNEFRTQNFKQFLFSKQLTKPPSEYAKGETISHVKVAMDRIKHGQRAQTLVNHTIYYIVCLSQESQQDSLAKCSFDDRTFERSQKYPDEKGPLQIDMEYYKKELLQPVGRITQHLHDFSTDRLLEVIGLSDENRKKFKRQMEAQREEGQAVLEGCISHSTSQKSKRFAQIVGQINCSCGFKSPVAEQGKLVTLCPSCKRILLPALSNRLQMLVRQKTNEYYNNHFKCKCTKQYALTPMSQCCKVKVKSRSNVPFQLHELVYLAKELVIGAEMGSSEDVGRKLKGLEEKLDVFLQESDYEKVEGVMSILKL